MGNHQTIHSSGLHFSQLKFEENDDDESPTLVISVRETPLRFVIRQNNEEVGKIRDWSNLEILECMYTQFLPGFPETDWLPESYYGNIEFVAKTLKSWLEDDVFACIEYNKIPDYWEHLRSLQPFAESIPFSVSDLEMFTEEEKEQIRTSLKEFRRLMERQLGDVAGNLDEIQVKLDYLMKAVDRLNRFDWKGVATSTIIGIATNLSVDVNTGKQIVALFQQALNKVIYLLPK